MKSSAMELEKETIISADEIKILLDRYRIGKKPLAKLLGWGETTIIRYIEGDIPTTEYSNKLRTILDDPEYYYQLLCKKKDSLTRVAFKKSKNAALSKIMATRIYAVSFYIVNKCGADICPGYIQYLIYYVQAFSLALRGKEMFQEECGINSKHKPYLKLYEGMKQCGVHTLDGIDEYLTVEETELIDMVLDSFLWYGPKALLDLTVYEQSLLQISKDDFNNKIISKDNLKEYFKNVLKQYQIGNVKAIHKYPDRKITELRTN